MRALANIADKVLIDHVLLLATKERQSQVELLKYLGELAERKLFLGLGYSSMWDFCRRALKFSESVSQQRLIVAKAARKYPATLTMLEDGSLTLCTAADLAPLLCDENVTAMLAVAAGKSRREVQNLTGAGKKTVERDVIRRMGASTSPKGRLGLTLEAQSLTPDNAKAPEGSPATAPAHSAAPGHSAAPVESSRHRVAFSASAEVVAKLEKLQLLLGDASLEEVVGKASELLLDKVDPARRNARRIARQIEVPAAGCKTKTAKRSARSAVHPAAKPAVQPRRPSRALADAVFVAAGQQCEYLTPGGLRCTETCYLSIDHIRPYALGGTSTDQRNLRCLCKAHNAHYARLSFPAWRLASN